MSPQKHSHIFQISRDRPAQTAQTWQGEADVTITKIVGAKKIAFGSTQENVSVFIPPASLDQLQAPLGDVPFKQRFYLVTNYWQIAFDNLAW